MPSFIAGHFFCLKLNFRGLWVFLVNISQNIGSEKVALKNGMIWEQKIDSYEGSPMNIFRIDRHNWKEQTGD